MRIRPSGAVFEISSMEAVSLVAVSVMCLRKVSTEDLSPVNRRFPQPSYLATPSKSQRRRAVSP